MILDRSPLSYFYARISLFLPPYLVQAISCSQSGNTSCHLMHFMAAFYLVLLDSNASCGVTLRSLHSMAYRLYPFPRHSPRHLFSKWSYIVRAPQNPTRSILFNDLRTYLVLALHLAWLLGRAKRSRWLSKWHIPPGTEKGTSRPLRSLNLYSILNHRSFITLLIPAPHYLEPRLEFTKHDVSCTQHLAAHTLPLMYLS